MRARPMRNRCLPESIMRALAIEVAGGDVRGTSWQAALSSGILERLLGADAGIAREHLETCDDCRERLERELRYLEGYRAGLRSSSVRDAARDILSASERGIIRILRFAPYLADDSPTAAMAAQTSSPEVPALRFCSADDKVLLKEVESPKGESRKRLFFLMADSPQLIQGATVLFAGSEYAPDGEGYFDFGDAALMIDQESEFVVKLRRE